MPSSFCSNTTAGSLRGRGAEVVTESGSRVLGFEFVGSKARLQLLGYMAQSFTC